MGEPLAATTLNERLFACGMTDRFDKAFAAGHREVLRTILIAVKVSDVAWTIDQLLDPGRS